ncbi:DivIVA domain-containing protein [Actinomycetes bacterium M1A6_2h]
MLTVLTYVVVIAVVAAVLFFVASAVFGRGEELEPLPKGTTATALPASGVTGRDVRALKFQVDLRGYDSAEVDWALDRVATEIDSLRIRLRDLEARVGASTPDEESDRGPDPLP